MSTPKPPNPATRTTGEALAAALLQYRQAQAQHAAAPALPPGWSITETPEAVLLEQRSGASHSRYLFHRAGHDVLAAATARFLTELAAHAAKAAQP